MQYERSIPSGLEVMAKVKVFVHATAAAADADGRAMTLAPRTYLSRLAKKLWYHVKGLVTRNTHVQYESPISSGFKVMAKAKDFRK